MARVCQAKEEGAPRTSHRRSDRAARGRVVAGWWQAKRVRGGCPAGRILRYDQGMQSEEPSSTEYDLWRWHTDGAFPKDQLPERGYVHIGVYVAWLINHDILDPDGV